MSNVVKQVKQAMFGWAKCPGCGEPIREDQIDAVGYGTIWRVRCVFCTRAWTIKGALTQEHARTYFRDNVAKVI